MKKTDYTIKPKPEELKTNEGRFWSATTVPVPDEVKAELTKGAMDPADVLHFENINRLLDPGYHKVEIGYCHCSNGIQYVACLTRMPGVTAEMIDWWFAWHPLNDIRYRIWFPHGHYAASVEDPQRCRDDTLPYRERYQNNRHTVIEDVGTGAMKLWILFVPPEKFGFDTSRFDEAGVGTAVCARVGFPDVLGGIYTTKMCHFVRKTEEGVEMRSRFWIGQEIRKPGKKENSLFNKITNTEFFKKQMLPKVAKYVANHAAEEYTNLASMLPQVFKEFKNRF